MFPSAPLTADQKKALKIDEWWLGLKIISARVTVEKLGVEDIPDSVCAGSVSRVLTIQTLRRFCGFFLMPWPFETGSVFSHLGVVLEIGHAGKTGLVEFYQTHEGFWMHEFKGDRETYVPQYTWTEPMSLRVAFDYTWSKKGQKYQYFSYNCIRFAFDLLVHLGVVKRGIRSFWSFYWRHAFC